VISIDSMGTLPVRILPHAANISLGLRLGFGAVALIGALMRVGVARLHLFSSFLSQVLCPIASDKPVHADATRSGEAPQ